MIKSRIFSSLIFAIFLIVSVSVGHSFNNAHACSCVVPDSPKNELQIYDAVFSGRVINIDEQRTNASIYSSADPLLVTFDIDRIWKGLENIHTITVSTVQSSASCGFGFENNLEYIVYATNYENQLEVSLCSRTNLLSEATEDLEELGMGIAAKPNFSVVMNPLKQFESGITVDKIQCRESLTLIVKHDDSPACVKPISVKELIERGWAKKIPSQISNIFTDTIFKNGLIYTVDEDNSWAESVAINDGIISFVGSNDNIQDYIGQNTRIIDLEGTLVLPGIHDVHLHVLEASSEFGGDCILDDSDPEEFISYFEECSSQQTDREWLVGWGHSILSLESSDLTPLEIIDEAIPDRPAIMLEQTSHSAWVNSRALELAGIDDNSDDPVAGILGRDLGTGKLNGILYENAGEIVMDLALTRTPEIDESNYEGLLFGLELLAENGITSITDAKVNLDRGFYDVWKRAEAEDTLTVRAVMSIWTHPHQDDDYQIDRIKALYSNDPASLLKLTQVKMYSDGLLESGTAKLVEPYLDDIGYGDEGKGINYFDEERITRYITELEKVGFDFHIHALGDGAVRESLNAIESAQNYNGNVETRHRLTHLELIHPDDISRFEELGVIADFQVAGEWTLPENNDYLEEVIGEQRLVDQIPVRSVYDTGAIVTLSSDYDVSSISPFVGMQHALSREHQSMPDLESVIESYTINGAYLMRQEDKTGSIEVGKFADLIVVDQNIFEVPINKIGDTKILFTYLEGEQVFP